MNIELFKPWQGFVKGDVVPTSTVIGAWLVDKKYGKTVDSTAKAEPKKRNIRQPRKPKRS